MDKEMMGARKAAFKRKPGVAVIIGMGGGPKAAPEKESYDHEVECPECGCKFNPAKEAYKKSASAEAPASAEENASEDEAEYEED